MPSCQRHWLLLQGRPQESNPLQEEILDPTQWVERIRGSSEDLGDSSHLLLQELRALLMTPAVVQPEARHPLYQLPTSEGPGPRSEVASPSASAALAAASAASAPPTVVLA